MSFASKQIGFTVSNNIGKFILSTNGSTLPISPATVVSGTLYVVANPQLDDGIWLAQLQLNLTGNSTTNFESIQLNVTNDLGTILFDNWLVGTTLKSTAQIELNGTYPIFVNIASGSGNVNFLITPTFTGTAPTILGLIKLFKIV